MLRLTLVVALIKFDAYNFLAVSDPTCHLVDKRIRVFWLYWPPDNKGIKLRSSDQEASPSASKNYNLVLVLCCTWKHVLTVICGGLDIS